MSINAQLLKFFIATDKRQIAAPKIVVKLQNSRWILTTPAGSLYTKWEKDEEVFSSDLGRKIKNKAAQIPSNLHEHFIH